jgi:hypothetical protein
VVADKHLLVGRGRSAKRVLCVLALVDDAEGDALRNGLTTTPILRRTEFNAVPRSYVLIAYFSDGSFFLHSSLNFRITLKMES